MKTVRYHIEKEDITEVLAFALSKSRGMPNYIDFNATTIMTGSAGLQKLAHDIKSKSSAEKSYNFLSYEAGGEKITIEAVYSGVMDSSLIDNRMYKGYPYLSYKMFVFHAGELVCEIEPKFPKKEEEE